MISELAAAMGKAAGELGLERAAVRRDQIATLRRIRERQHESGEGASAATTAPTSWRSWARHCATTLEPAGANSADGLPRFCEK